MMCQQLDVLIASAEVEAIGFLQMAMQGGRRSAPVGAGRRPSARSAPVTAG